MALETIMTLIGNYCFPIVACIVMGWYVKYQTDKNTTDIKTITEQHKTEMDKITEALNNNTMALNTLINKLGDR